MTDKSFVIGCLPTQLQSSSWDTDNLVYKNDIAQPLITNQNLGNKRFLCPYTPRKNELKNYISKPQQTPEIFVWTNLANKILKAGVDSASPITFVKLESIEKMTNTFMYHWNISGITKDTIQTEGSVNLKIYLDKETLSIPAQVVSGEKSGLDYDILLGSDFQVKYKVGISRKFEHISLEAQNKEHIFGIHKTKSMYNIPPNSESIHLVKTTKSILGYVQKKQLEPGVFIPNAVVDATRGYSFVKILNITPKNVVLDNLEVEVEEIPDEWGDILNTQRENKMEILKTQMDVEHIPDEYKEKLISLIEKFTDIFILPEEPLNTTPLIKHDIDLVPGAKPIYKRQPPISIDKEEKLREMLMKLRDQKVIEKTGSHWNHLIFLIPKKNGELRAILDFRPLNDLTIDQKYNLPSIEELLGKIGDATIFTNLDLSSAYHQVELTERSKDYCAFSAGKFGRWRYRKMPFGISGAPYTFQFLMDSIFTVLDEAPIDVLAYLDDLLIYSKDMDSHMIQLEKVFEKLLNANLKINMKKCNFMKDEVEYLGFKISENKVTPPEEYVKSLQEIRPPKNKKELQRFLGKVGYLQKFIKHFQAKVRPLSELLKDEVTFEMKEKQLQAFESIRNELLEVTHLSLPKHKEYELHIDASSKGIGAMLRNAGAPDEPPIMYLSAVLKDAQTRYSATELEMFALTYFVKKLSHYLLGRKFTVYTDHKALTSIFKSKNIDNLRLNRMKLSLVDYDKMDIKYVKGKSNTVPDYLSRHPGSTEAEDLEELLEEPVNTLVVTRAQKAKQNLKQTTNKDIPSICVPPQLIQQKSPTKNIKLGVKKKVRFKPTTEAKDYDLFAKTLWESIELKSKFVKEFLPKLVNNTIDFKKCIDIYRLPKKIPIVRITIGQEKRVKITNLGLSIEDSKEEQDDYDLYITVLLILEYMSNLNLRKIVLMSSLLEEKLSLLKKIVSELCTNDSVILFYERNVEVIKNDDKVKQILDDHHTSKTAGHPGVNRMFDAIRARFYFKNMYSRIQKYVRQCLTCRKIKNEKSNTQPMIIPHLPSKPFELIAMDVYGPIVESEPDGFKNILVITDYFSGFTIMSPMKEPNSEGVAKIIVNDLILPFGRFPKLILSDNASYFGSNLLKDVMKMLNIKQKFITPRAPWQNVTERRNQFISYYLKATLCEMGQKEIMKWPELLKFISYSINASVNRTTGFCPLEILFGLDAEGIEDLQINPQKSRTYNEYLENLQERLSHIRHTAKQSMIEARNASKNYKDLKAKKLELKANEWVLWKNPKSTLGKLDFPKMGPYQVLEVFPNSAKIRTGRNHKVVPIEHLYKYDAPLDFVLYVKINSLSEDVKASILNTIE